MEEATFLWALDKISILALRILLISKMIDAAGREDRLWTLELRSFQSRYITAWKTSLNITLTLLSWEGALIQSNTSMNRGGGERWKAEQKASHTSLLKPHSKNKCWRISFSELHRGHNGEMETPQRLILSRVDNRSRVTNQVRKACFGILPLNHTDLCHGTSGRLSNKWAHIRELEKVVLGGGHYQFSTRSNHPPLRSTCILYFRFRGVHAFFILPDQTRYIINIWKTFLEKLHHKYRENIVSSVESLQ